MQSAPLMLLVLPLAAGCATARQTPTSTLSGDFATARTAVVLPLDVIGRAELNTKIGRTAVEAIRQLRPQFLEGSQPPALNGVRTFPSVYVENRPFAGLETLSGIPVVALDEVRFLRPIEARTVYGPSCACAAGVIALRMRRDDAPPGVQHP